MEELRRALSDVSADDRAASDGRVLDGFVDDRKGQLNAPLDDLTRSLDSVEKNIEERLQGELASVESDFLNRIDAAVDSGHCLEPRARWRASLRAQIRARTASAQASARLASPARLFKAAAAVAAAATSRLRQQNGARRRETGTTAPASGPSSSSLKASAKRHRARSDTATPTV